MGEVKFVEVSYNFSHLLLFLAYCFRLRKDALKRGLENGPCRVRISCSAVQWLEIGEYIFETSENFNKLPFIPLNPFFKLIQKDILVLLININHNLKTLILITNIL